MDKTAPSANISSSLSFPVINGGGVLEGREEVWGCVEATVLRMFSVWVTYVEYHHAPCTKMSSKTY